MSNKLTAILSKGPIFFFMSNQFNIKGLGSKEFYEGNPQIFAQIASFAARSERIFSLYTSSLAGRMLRAGLRELLRKLLDFVDSLQLLIIHRLCMRDKDVDM